MRSLNISSIWCQFLESMVTFPPATVYRYEDNKINERQLQVLKTPL